VEEITQHSLQNRIIVVLPSPDDDVTMHREALQQACVLLAVMETFAGTMDEVDSLRVHQWEVNLHERTLVIALSKDSEAHQPMVSPWHTGPRVGRTRVAAPTYRSCLNKSFNTVQDGFANTNFATRYPWPRL
jgi:hypothetical protein